MQVEYKRDRKRGARNKLSHSVTMQKGRGRDRTGSYVDSWHIN